MGINLVRFKLLAFLVSAALTGVGGALMGLYLGIVSVEKLKAFRAYFIVLAFIVAAVLTPPDVVSQLALAIPMILLYEMGIWAAQIFIRHTKAPQEEEKPAA